MVHMHWLLRLLATLVICIIRSMDDKISAHSNGFMYFSPKTTKFRYINYIILSLKSFVISFQRNHTESFTLILSFQMGWVGKNDWCSLSFWQLVLFVLTETNISKKVMKTIALPRKAFCKYSIKTCFNKLMLLVTLIHKLSSFNNKVKECVHYSTMLYLSQGS